MSRALRSTEALLRVAGAGWDSARTPVRKPPTTAQADEALSRDLGVEFVSRLAETRGGWSVMRRANGTHYLYPGKHLEDPDCVQVHDSRVNADAAIARLNTPKADDAAMVRAAAAYMDQVNGCEEDTIRAAEAAGFVRDESITAPVLVQVEAFLHDGLRAVAKRMGGEL